ncbi:unnamed protein product [Penicillium egyptiacum]|uniref:Uncharacterized protein n=1 Tax=Penicillium egyptiacum TaxID=1303716 RepID=A0A9W4P4F0_9EURO|nr:unnamed protein product [Penicillium egyptiacum]
MQAAQKHPTSVALEPSLNFTQKRLCQTPRDILGNLCDQGHDPNPLSRIVHNTAPLLAGKSLDRMNGIMLRQLLPIINDMGNDETVDLNTWLRQTVTIIDTNATYGNLNPFKNPHIGNTFWWVHPT